MIPLSSHKSHELFVVIKQVSTSSAHFEGYYICIFGKQPVETALLAQLDGFQIFSTVVKNSFDSFKQCLLTMLIFLQI